ncbi:Uncharacterized protein TCM_012315 [Theobroma cacao]|uniref:Uncharacterized protein n=1 Tax=Theobroma cacao TaxID=3641 RepID=A0A061FV78_THECC|nr:Uncharacterized protein TCM_012315 [Theobroma cacao]
MGKGKKEGVVAENAQFGKGDGIRGQVREKGFRETGWLLGSVGEEEEEESKNEEKGKGLPATFRENQNHVVLWIQKEEKEEVGWIHSSPNRCNFRFSQFILFI